CQKQRPTREMSKRCQSAVFVCITTAALFPSVFRKRITLLNSHLAGESIEVAMFLRLQLSAN
ncbi:hypothetical protein J6590_104730, partial [Homalodisca vitripennis]